jgi:hypothetical protein
MKKDNYEAIMIGSVGVISFKGYVHCANIIQLLKDNEDVFYWKEWKLFNGNVIVCSLTIYNQLLEQLDKPYYDRHGNNIH